jgi:inner membrane protein
MLIAGAVAGAWARTARPFVAVATAAAYGSHVLLDWLGADPSAPRGVMALWPLSGEFHLSDAHLFLRVCREYWLADCWWHNLRAVARELVILGPITVAAVVAARRALRPPRGGRTSSR